MWLPPVLFLLGGDKGGGLFGSEGSELAIEGAKDLCSVLLVKDNDWWDLLLEDTPALLSAALDCCWCRWLLMGALTRLLLIAHLLA